ncbi:MAG: Sua5/YciO/YrdC/YwlC family protein, partial [Eggerthellales bacterium]|nr:Sua5/YciO/YrdC/YwlC family protein [Eggerthellales bacterium]
MTEALDIQVHGIVQGVGFRPFVFNCARDHDLTGWVLNGTAGVFIHAEGDSDALDRFVMDINDHAPAASRVTEILLEEVPVEGFVDFSIRLSQESDGQQSTLVSPDLACCPDCVRELFDPADRRYHYPFINCTSCGPRFTITGQLPYDRRNTSMAGFPMCPQCQREYQDPADRRFHAQPDACFECGPHISWKACPICPDGPDSDWTWGDTREVSDAIISRACQWLRAGRILAVKGLGGFHLVCDAANPDALALLRQRKHRPNKAFAVMFPHMEAIRETCLVNKAEADLLQGSVRPIVLLRKRPGAPVAPGLADNLPELGCMLPYTPLQHLLLAEFGGPLVMTSGNISGQPIEVDDEACWAALGQVADGVLGNNRPILTRFDDSVVRVISFGGDDATHDGQDSRAQSDSQATTAICMIRRARGYAPMPIPVPEACLSAEDTPPVIFAAGPEQK